MTSNEAPRRRAAMLAFLALALAAPASAQDDAANADVAEGEAPATPATPDGARVVAHQALIALLNPMGAEHRLDIGIREELGSPGDIFTMGSHVEAGVTTAVSPVYGMGGGYFQLQPLSFLVLRA